MQRNQIVQIIVIIIALIFPFVLAYVLWTNPLNHITWQVNRDKLDEAQSRLNLIISEEPYRNEKSRIYFLQGIIQFKKENFPDAKKYFLKSLNIDHRFIDKIEKCLTSMMLETSMPFGKQEFNEFSCHTPVLLHGMLRSSSPLININRVRTDWLIAAIAKCKREEFIPDLYVLAGKSEHPDTVKKSLYVLIKLDPDFFDKIVEVISDISVFKKLEFCQYLSALDEPKLVPVFRTFSHSSIPEVRRQFNLALTRCKNSIHRRHR